MREQFFGKRPGAILPLYGDTGRQALPEDQVSYLAPVVFLADELLDELDHVFFMDVLLLAQRIPDCVGQGMGVLVGKTPLHQVGYEHPAHEGDAFFSIDDSSHI